MRQGTCDTQAAVQWRVMQDGGRHAYYESLDAAIKAAELVHEGNVVIDEITQQDGQCIARQVWPDPEAGQAVERTPDVSKAAKSKAYRAVRLMERHSPYSGGGLPRSFDNIFESGSERSKLDAIRLMVHWTREDDGLRSLMEAHGLTNWLTDPKYAA